MLKREYQMCTRCIMDTSDPMITFDSSGVCNHCEGYDEWAENHFKNEPLELRTQAMVSQIKAYGKGKEYDCIIGLSGGVDSSYLAYYATQKLGLRVMAVHVDGGWNSELAVNNIENIVKKLNIDLHTIVIDWEEIKDLQRAFFKSSLPNCDTPQDHAFFAALYKEAVKFNHKHVLTGGNMATESILPGYWGYDPMDYVHVKDVHKRFGEKKLKSYPFFTFWDKWIIYPLIHRFKVHRPLDYIDYNKNETKEFLKKELGWRDYGGKHYESKFTHFFQAHYLPEKFGFDKRRAHLSSLIVSGQLSRDEALAEIKQDLYSPVELENDQEYFLKKLGFSSQEWQKIMAQNPKTENDYKTETPYYKILKVGYNILTWPKKLIKKD